MTDGAGCEALLPHFSNPIRLRSVSRRAHFSNNRACGLTFGRPDSSVVSVCGALTRCGRLGFAFFCGSRACAAAFEPSAARFAWAYPYSLGDCNPVSLPMFDYTWFWKGLSNLKHILTSRIWRRPYGKFLLMLRPNEHTCAGRPR